ncbi:hypothetical protein BT96DRAFT_1003074 [Gymnopus androsaceus JB14]|uniref:Uncharacterized protein n=1 Tax=Gymnopus androsaceus JB14 TaxID=1447944 RepID=A0A6A4GW09_9AGAR|nr:hypothetical protein BT96DRAFT_1003074 [Gymnopus androsaceus JB14]
MILHLTQLLRSEAKKKSEKVSDGAKKAKKPPTSAIPEAKEVQEPEFTSTGDFDNSCDVPVEVMIEHVISEGKKDIVGLAVNEGGLKHTADAEDPDIKVPVLKEDEVEKLPEAGPSLPHAVELRRGKQDRKALTWQTKDWVFT